MESQQSPPLPNGDGTLTRRLFRVTLVIILITISVVTAVATVLELNQTRLYQNQTQDIKKEIRVNRAAIRELQRIVGVRRE